MEYCFNFFEENGYKGVDLQGHFSDGLSNFWNDFDLSNAIDITNTSLETGDYVGNAAEFARYEMIAARTSQNALSNVGRSGNLKAIYWLGSISKWLGRIGNVGGILSIGMDANSVSNGNQSAARFSYNTSGTISAIGVGAVCGGVYGALVGAGFSAGQGAYDGLVWFGEELSKGASQFNNAWRNGWLPGMKY